jgi:hypothetical protein
MDFEVLPQYVVRYAKEESFGSSLSRKACGSLRAEPSITKALYQNVRQSTKANKLIPKDARAIPKSTSVYQRIPNAQT